MICRMKAESRTSSMVAVVRTAPMPQPISTPTAFGMTASRHAMTPPIGMPYPTWQSGIRATWDTTTGWAARLAACDRASGSGSGHQDFTGTRALAEI